MAVSPEKKMDKTTIVNKIVKSGVTVTEGVGVKKSSGGELEVDICGANDKCSGIALETVVGDGKKTVQVAELDGGIVPVKCSATATCGEAAICGVAGFENQIVGGGTTVKYLSGFFTQDGVVGDFVGLQVSRFAAGCA